MATPPSIAEIAFSTVMICFRDMMASGALPFSGGAPAPSVNGMLYGLSRRNVHRSTHDILCEVMAGILTLMFLAVATPPAESKMQVIEHYAVQVPAGYVLKDVSPKLMDFELYALTDSRSGEVKCTLYVGNNPRFPTLRWSGNPSQSHQGAGTRREFRSADRIEGVMMFERVSKSSLMSPFQVIHYFADHLSAVDMKAVAALVDSVIVVHQDLQ
jgi:hypothetical protein